MKLESSIEPPSAPLGFGQVGRIPNWTLEKWQSIVNTMAELVNVPAGLIMQINGADIVCLIASMAPRNIESRVRRRWAACARQGPNARHDRAQARGGTPKNLDR